MSAEEARRRFIEQLACSALGAQLAVEVEARQPSAAHREGWKQRFGVDMDAEARGEWARLVVARADAMLEAIGAARHPDLRSKVQALRDKAAADQMLAPVSGDSTRIAAFDEVLAILDGKDAASELRTMLGSSGASAEATGRRHGLQTEAAKSPERCDECDAENPYNGGEDDEDWHELNCSQYAEREGS